MWYFTFSTIKTVDDHCGYAFPWDPLQRLTGNNAAYHDVHHQSWGIKNNFSQPFFTFWDRFMGTKWTGNVKLRYERTRETVQKQVEMDASQASADTSANDTSEGTVVSPEESTDSNTGSRLRRKTASLTGAKHGVRSNVLQK